MIFVEGADVQINGNITYNASNASLVIIARKVGTAGGNIYVSPSVTGISATLIADGALMNGTNAQPINWLSYPSQLTNKLTINGRLSTYNTRGGSLTVGASGGTLDNISIGSTGKCFNGMSLNTSCSSVIAASQDLERFRVTSSTSGSCTLYVTGSNPTIIDVLSNLTF